MKKMPNFIKKREGINQARPENEIKCLNCDTIFFGHYCPNCGQPVKEFDKPFSFVFYNFVGDFFSFDTRFLKTFFQLIFYPGKLTSEFFAGRRTRYAPPFRVFIFMSFLLFLLLQIYTSQELKKILEKSPTNIEFNLADSTKENELRAGIIVKDKPDTTSLSKDSIVSSSENSRQMLTKLAIKLENELGQETNPRKKAAKEEAIRLLRSPEQALSKALKLISWAFFLLLPIFALLLKFVYIRRKQNYIRHFIFSTHFHSFLFFDLIIIILLILIFSHVPGWLILISLLLIPVYFVISLKNFYRQNLLKTIVKSLIVALLYNIIFWFAITGVVYLMVH